MSWLKRILTTSASLLVAIMIIGLILPSQVHVERTITIDARPQKIYSFISDFKKWEQWSPWAKIDPDAEFSVVGRGKQQKMFWSMMAFKHFTFMTGIYLTILFS